jgi:hypothetical protein
MREPEHQCSQDGLKPSDLLRDTPIQWLRDVGAVCASCSRFVYADGPTKCYACRGLDDLKWAALTMDMRVSDGDALNEI